jgi:hypothetical protein
MKVNQTLIRKLTSRKFWTMVCGFLTLLLTAKGMDGGSIQQIVSIIMAGGAVIAYIVSEAWVDTVSIANPTQEI